MSDLPLISIVTPTFNCAPYIRDCIESVRSQNYPAFEHIIVDGASSDETVSILREYSHLKWISEPDNGEAEALNKGLALAKGDIIGWLNADDYYAPNIFTRIAREVDPQKNRHFVYGNTDFVDESGHFVWRKKSRPVMRLPFLLQWWRNTRHPHQPSIFFSRSMIEDIGNFNTALNFSIDYEYWLRCKLKYRFYHVAQVLSYVRIRAGAKSSEGVPEQHRSHHQISLPYLRRLGSRARLNHFLALNFFLLTSPIRQRLAIGTRMKSLRNRFRSR
jgi:glycosyltransferase involved in cell wall biosynthesis